MRIVRFALPFMLVMMFALAVTACAQQPTVSTTTGSSSSSPTATTSSPTATTSSNALIHTGTATVKGTSETILTNAQGLTLYYRTTDNPPSKVCSGACAGAWPPILFTGSGSPTSSTQLSGKLTAVTDANGNQVEYNGHPLYTFASDSAPGQTNGEGVGGIWFVVTPGLK
jgi:predicted lipoprotein with Yx(FWY)xxD motif